MTTEKNNNEEMQVARIRIFEICVGQKETALIGGHIELIIPMKSNYYIDGVEMNDEMFQALSDKLDEQYKDVVEFSWELIGVEPLTK